MELLAFKLSVSKEEAMYCFHQKINKPIPMFSKSFPIPIHSFVDTQVLH